MSRSPLPPPMNSGWQASHPRTRLPSTQIASQIAWCFFSIIISFAGGTGEVQVFFESFWDSSKNHGNASSVGWTSQPGGQRQNHKSAFFNGKGRTIARPWPRPLHAFPTYVPLAASSSAGAPIWPLHIWPHPKPPYPQPIPSLSCTVQNMFSLRTLCRGKPNQTIEVESFSSNLGLFAFPFFLFFHSFWFWICLVFFLRLFFCEYAYVNTKLDLTILLLSRLIILRISLGRNGLLAIYQGDPLNVASQRQRSQPEHRSLAFSPTTPLPSFSPWGERVTTMW